MRVAVLTVSDAGARGEREDRSGDAIAAWVASRRDTLAARDLVPDEAGRIVDRLTSWCDDDTADVILTTGGTGLSARDVTPEATRVVLDREAPGIAERIRVSCIESFPRAALARGIAGVRHRTLIVNLPGSTTGVVDALSALEPILSHGVAVLRGSVTDHDPGAG